MSDVLHFTGAGQDECWPLIRDHHYSGRMPSNIQHCFAVRREGGLFGHTGEVEAAVLFSIPPTRWSQPDIIELSRLVRLPSYGGSLSQLIGFGLAWLKRRKWHLVVSFADVTHNHHGGVYQASNWCYDGMRSPTSDGLMIDGVFKPGRSCNSAFGTRSAKKLAELMPETTIEEHRDDGKHLYWKALTVRGGTMAKRLGLKAAPYPKPIAGRSLDEHGSPVSEAGTSPATRSNLPKVAV